MEAKFKFSISRATHMFRQIRLEKAEAILGMVGLTAAGVVYIASASGNAQAANERLDRQAVTIRELREDIKRGNEQYAAIRSDIGTINGKLEIIISRLPTK